MAPTTIAASKVECAVAAADLLGETPLWCDRSRKLIRVRLGSNWRA